MKKSGLWIGLVLVLCLFGYNPIFAASPNVMECLEGDAECPELNELSDRQNNSVDTSKEPGVSEDHQSFALDFIKMIAVLLLVLALIYFLSKFINKRSKLFSQVRTLENVGGISLGPNKSIQIVRIGTKMYLIGVGDNVELLREITDEDVKNELLQDRNENDFKTSNLVTTFIQSRREDSETNQFKSLYTAELEKLKQGRKNLILQHMKKEDKHE